MKNCLCFFFFLSFFELFMIAKIPQIPYHRTLNIKFGF